MSFGHLKFEIKPLTETLKILGEGDTPELFALPYDVDHTYDWPYGGGNSVDGATVYIDRTLYDEVMRGLVQVSGMTPSQIIRVWCLHEHAEWAVEFGDNAADDYQPSHEHATTIEEHNVETILRVNPQRYEECIKSGLQRCVRRFIKLGTKANPPRDIWCGPVLDEPDADDKEIIRILRAKGVRDAFKCSKAAVRYGIGPEECRACAMYGDRDVHLDLRYCDLVSGLVRANRHCERWVARSKGK
jgi:hypothetical protein